MGAPYEVDPCGDVFVTLRNLGAPFAALPDIFFTIMSDTCWFFVQPSGKGRKGKKKKKRGTFSCYLISIRSSRSCVSGTGSVVKAEPIAGGEIAASVVEQAPPVEEAAVAAVAEPSTEESSAFAAEETVTEANSAVASKPVIRPDDWQGDGSAEQGEDRSPQPPPDIEFRVSSRHLILASPFFKAALNGPWEESMSSSVDGCRRIYAADWDPQAFLILMHSSTVVTARCRDPSASIC